MNKRGQEGWVIVGAVIAVAVVVAGFGGVYFFKEDIAKWVGFLPIPGKIDTSKNVLEIVGFRVVDGKIYQYTGSQWIPSEGAISGELDMNDKEINVISIGNKFQDFYLKYDRGGMNNKIDLGGGRQAMIVSKTPIQKTIWASEKAPDWWDVSKVEYSRLGYVLDWIGLIESKVKGSENTIGGIRQEGGDIPVIVYTTDSKGGASLLEYSLIVKINGDVWVASYKDGVLGNFDRASMTDEVSKIVNFVVDWRDSILSAPIFIQYKKNVDGEWLDLSDHFCIEKYKPDFLIVRLNKPEELGADAICKQDA